MIEPIPYGRQHISDEDIQAVVEVLKSDYLTQGPKIAAFEKDFAAYIGSKYAVAVANGTAALHLCTMALEVQPGDKVITSPITFAASANCIRYCGGEVVFADIDQETYLLDIHKVRALLESSPKGTYQGIVPVDFAGRAVDLEAFRKLADEFDCWLIEDACHAPGAYFTDSKGNKQHCGNGNFAELAIFSFHPVKHIACGEGGMITTNDVILYKKILTLRTHGITRDSSLFLNTVDFAIGHSPLAISPVLPTDKLWPSWYMEMQALGYNYRLTDFQAALGISQLKRADKGIKRRREIATKYYEEFRNVNQITDNNLLQTSNFELQVSNTNNGHAFHLYIIEVENRYGLYNYLRENSIFTQIHYIPCHLMPYYRKQGWNEGDLPLAERYYKSCISLPMFPTLTNEEQQYVIDKTVEFISKGQ
jgi:UDP-4-amino-4,6-dideoxy-N-acetyl-beta-L-altrosamine transaminase